MLAFKSDVSHWRKKDELTGVSVRYVFSAESCNTIVNSPQNGVFLHSRGTLRMPNSLYDADHHERFRAVRDFIVSH